MWIYISIFVIYISVFIYERKKGNNKVLHAFAAYIWNFICKRMRKNLRTEKSLAVLYPQRKGEELIKEYYISKIALILLIILFLTIICFIISIQKFTQHILFENKYLSRNSYGQGERKEELLVSIPGVAELAPYEISVAAQKYTKAEAEKLIAERAVELADYILGDNNSLDEVKSDLELLTVIPETPIHISWKSDSYQYIDPDGRIQKEVPEQGVKVVLTAELSCGEVVDSYPLEVKVFPPDLSAEERMFKDLDKAVEEMDSQTAHQERLELPEEVAGYQVVWEEKREDYDISLFILGIFAAVIIYFGKDRELSKKIAERKLQMLIDYPEILSKMLLFMGAGMPVKKAWKEIVESYKKEKENGHFRYAYEEMFVAYNEMLSGVPEYQAYERFGCRCGIQHYIKFSNLLIQNMKKGNQGIVLLFQEEGMLALEERKNTARKMGEEAGTKLLLPMIMMLGIVLIVVMIPAFLSFRI